MTCPSCHAEVLEIDVRCAACGTALGASGAHRMVGSIVLGQYEVVDVLGQGGMSIVYKGRHKMTEQEVALKILPPELAAHSQVKSRFLEEARALATLDHANIVHLYNFGQENGCFVLAMQLVAGQTWERMILEAKRLPWADTARVAIDVLRALEYAHGRGVIHRDMKPSNVLVRAHDHAATVMDFGIAKMTTSTKLTATGQTMGTVRYMSPEQVRGQEVDPRTDLYSLGATMFESLTGDTPFDGTTHFEIMTKHLSEAPPRPSARGVELPAALEDAVMRSLAKKPEDRFESARDMRKAIESVLRDNELGLVETQRVSRDILAAAIASPPAASAPPKPRAVFAATELADRLEPPPARARPSARGGGGKWIALAAVVLLAGAGGGAAYLWSQRPARATTTTVKVGDLEIETREGGVTKTDVTKAYREALEALDTQVRLAHLDRVVVQRPIDRIRAVPREALCDPRQYETGTTVPRNCSNELYALSSTTAPRTLLVADDPKLLPLAMRQGVGETVCVFHAFAVGGDATGDANAKLVDEICQVTSDFANGSAVH